jgi:adenylate cyclase
VAEAMESYYTDRLNEIAGLLAYHFEAAGQSLSAAKYAARAAVWVGSTSSEQAIKHWQKVRQLLRDQARSQEIDTLRIMASGQISWLGWREGLTAERVRPYIEEALCWAREIDDTMIPLLLFVEGRIAVASGGPADTYVERVKEALSLLNPGKDVGRAATLYAALSQAYGWAGLLEEALAANDAALEGVSSIEKFDHQFLGYSVEHWATSLRGRILARLGQFEEAQRCFEVMLSIDKPVADPTVQFIAHLGYIDIAWCRDDAPSAELHASRVAEIAQKHGSPYLRVFAFACGGTAKSIAKDFAGAVREFTDGLTFVRKTKAAMEYEAEILASLCDCHYRAGEFELAEISAKEAIDIARQRSSRLPECRASITYGATLVARHGSARYDHAEALFLRAEELIRLSGARIYDAHLALERARLSALVDRPGRPH